MALNFSLVLACLIIHFEFCSAFDAFAISLAELESKVSYSMHTFFQTFAQTLNICLIIKLDLVLVMYSCHLVH